MDKSQIAHDLAITYLNNRYGAEVTGQFSVSTWEKDVTGDGSVETKRLPDVDAVRTVRVPTGEKQFFGLMNKTTPVASGFEVDGVFTSMIEDYYRANSRFLELLDNR